MKKIVEDPTTTPNKSLTILEFSGAFEFKQNPLDFWIKGGALYISCFPCHSRSGTLPWNINGSSSFCKGPRTSKVWKSKDPQGPGTLRLCMSEDLCKNYYSHLYFTVVTFLTKIQNWCYITKKTCQNTTIKKVGW